MAHPNILIRFGTKICEWVTRATDTIFRVDWIMSHYPNNNVNNYLASLLDCC